MKQYIYSLYHYLNQSDEKIYFYVGHTNDLERRFKEHHYNSDAKTEDVYQYIRTQVLCEIFEMDCLAEVTDQDEPYEEFWVIEMIRAGYPLQNMKHGDAKMMALSGEANTLNKNKVVINSAHDLRVYREGEKARLLREKILNDGSIAAPEGSITFDHLAKKVTTKKVRNTSVADARHQAWLKENNHLFDELVAAGVSVEEAIRVLG